MLRDAADRVAACADDAALALTTEQGKTLAESRAELARAVETFAWHAGAAPAVCAPRCVAPDTTIHPEPVGIVAAFTPWNYPAVIVARKLAAALATGDPVVLKRAIAQAFGRRPVLVGEGGSNPVVAVFADALGAQTIVFGIGLPTDNAHAPDEHLRLEQFRRGARAAARLYRELAEEHSCGAAVAVQRPSATEH